MMTEKMEILFFLTDYFSFESVWGGRGVQFYERV